MATRSKNKSRVVDTTALGEVLTNQYRLSCELCNTYPVWRVTHQLSRGLLDIDIMALSTQDWVSLCSAITNRCTPSKISIQVSEVSPTKEFQRTLKMIADAISKCLSTSKNLIFLKLSRFPLNGSLNEALCQGLRNTKTLDTIELVNCSLKDKGTERLCQSIKNVPSIRILKLTNNGLTNIGCTAVANLIKHQGLNRDSAMWQDTLRLGLPHLDNMRGLRRITMNNNPKLGEQGLQSLVETLEQDLWIKAIDLQHCGLTKESGRLILKLLSVNKVLEVIDLRNNPFVEKQVQLNLKGILNERNEEGNGKWCMEDMMEPKSAHVLSGERRYSETCYTSPNKKQDSGTKHITNVKAQPGIPWRIESRLLERREGLAPGSTQNQEKLTESQEQSSTIEADKESMPEEDRLEESFSLDEVQKLCNYYKRKAKKEKQERKTMEKRLQRVLLNIKDKYILEETAVIHIEKCFLRFQQFLNYLQRSSLHFRPKFTKTMETQTQTLHKVSEYFLPNCEDKPSTSISVTNEEQSDEGQTRMENVPKQPQSTDHAQTKGPESKDRTEIKTADDHHLTRITHETEECKHNTIKEMPVANPANANNFPSMADLQRDIEIGQQMLDNSPRSSSIDSQDVAPVSEVPSKETSDDNQPQLQGDLFEPNTKGAMSHLEGYLNLTDTILLKKFHEDSSEVKSYSKGKSDDEDYDEDFQEETTKTTSSSTKGTTETDSNDDTIMNSKNVQKSLVTSTDGEDSDLIENSNIKVNMATITNVMPISSSSHQNEKFSTQEQQLTPMTKLSKRSLEKKHPQKEMVDLAYKKSEIKSNRDETIPQRNMTADGVDLKQPRPAIGPVDLKSEGPVIDTVGLEDLKPSADTMDTLGNEKYNKRPVMDPVDLETTRFVMNPVDLKNARPFKEPVDFMDPTNLKNAKPVMDPETDTEISQRNSIKSDISKSEWTETDDEKLRQLGRGRIHLSARSGSSSSIQSISIQLQQGHNLWSRTGEPRKKTFSKLKNISNSSEQHSSHSISNEEKQSTYMDYEEYKSDFEISDVDGLSLSSVSVVSTDNPEGVTVTEDF
ncbi:uncharacterized protein LOC143033964 isoform X2 [Oratosquilla oratoria]